MRFRAPFHFRDLGVPILGDNVFNRWQIWQRAPLFFRDLENWWERRLWCFFFSDFDILEDSLTRGCIRKEVCWVILVPRVDNFLQNHDELYSRKNSSPGKRKMIYRLVKEKREHSISKWNKGVWLRTWINLSWQFKCKQAHESARLAT